jgi:hypothetical protein
MNNPTPADALRDVIEALDACPWCGQKMERAIVSEGSTFRWRKVDGCCADGPEIRHDTMADDQEAAEVDSRRRAIEAWNDRDPTIRRALATLAAVEAAPVGLVIGQSGPDILGPQAGAIVQMDDPASIKGQRVALVRAGEG